MTTRTYEPRNCQTGKGLIPDNAVERTIDRSIDGLYGGDDPANPLQHWSSAFIDGSISVEVKQEEVKQQEVK